MQHLIWKARQQEDSDEQDEQIEILDAKHMQIETRLWYFATQVYQDAPKNVSYMASWIISLGPNVSWTDLHHWANMNEIKLNFWEANTLKKLSGEWQNHMQNKDLCSPYTFEADEHGNAADVTKEQILAQIEQIKG